MKPSKFRRWLAVWCGSALALAAVASADSITLNDGTEYQGTVRHVDHHYEITLANGSVKTVAEDKVRSVTLSPQGREVSEDTAKADLASLRRTVENLDDLKTIIDRYEKFIDRVAEPVPSVADDARKDLESWKQRLEEHRLKVGKRWVTPIERKELFLQSLQTIDQIRTLTQQNRIADAQDLLRKASDDDPQNPSYLYLNGVMAARRAQWSDARKDFDAVFGQIGNHAPTLSNRALIAAQAHRWPIAIQQMDLAMAIEPNNPTLVDNCAELLNMIPDANRKGPVFERLAARFGEQDQFLQTDFAKRGLYRWGSSWVSQDKLTDIKKEREAFEAKKKDLDGQYNDVLDVIQRDKDQIKTNEQIMVDSERDSYWIDQEGVTHRMPLPSAYYDAKRQIDQLNGDITDQSRKIGGLKAQAVELVKTQPSPPFHGSLALIAEDGVPVVVPSDVKLDPSQQPAAPAPTEPGPRIAVPIDLGPTTQPAMSDPSAGPASTAPMTRPSAGEMVP